MVVDHFVGALFAYLAATVHLSSYTQLIFGCAFVNAFVFIALMCVGGDTVLAGSRSVRVLHRARRVLARRSRPTQRITAQ